MTDKTFTFGMRVSAKDDAIQRVHAGSDLEEDDPDAAAVQRLGGHKPAGQEGDSQVREGDHVWGDEVEDTTELSEDVKVLDRRWHDVLTGVIVHQLLYGQVTERRNAHSPTITLLTLTQT